MLKNNKMLYGLLVLFVGLAMSFSTATAQVTGEEAETKAQKSFTGKVVNAVTGEALSDVTVEVEGQDVQATTGQDGKFTLENLGTQGQGMGVSGGDITLRINHEGYEELTETISASELGQAGQQQGQQQQGGQQQGMSQEEVRTFELQPKQGEKQNQEEGGMPPVK